MTTLSDEQKFIKLLAHAGVAAGQPVDDAVMDFYLERIRPHGFATGLLGLGRLIDDLKQGRPLPSVREILDSATGSGQNGDDEAASAAERIVGALRRFGSARGTRPDEKGDPEGYAAFAPFARQRAYMGELAWAVVEQAGGWQAICDGTTNDDLPTLESQWRRAAKSIASRVRAGLPAAPALPSGPDDSGYVNAIAAGAGENLPAVRGYGRGG